jgi:hypothetical protein
MSSQHPISSKHWSHEGNESESLAGPHDGFATHHAVHHAFYYTVRHTSSKSAVVVNFFEPINRR